MRTHGVKGEVQIYPYSDYSEVFTEVSEVIVDNKIMKISSVRNKGKYFLLKFEGIDSVNDAENLGKCFIEVQRNALPDLPDNDSYYICDLEDLDVFDQNDNHLGTVSKINESAGHDILVVEGDKGEILIPVVKSHITKIDLDEKSIKVNILEGMIQE